MTTQCRLVIVMFREASRIAEAGKGLSEVETGVQVVVRWECGR